MKQINKALMTAVILLASMIPSAGISASEAPLSPGLQVIAT